MSITAENVMARLTTGSNPFKGRFKEYATEIDENVS